MKWATSKTAAFCLTCCGTWRRRSCRRRICSGARSAFRFEFAERDEALPRLVPQRAADIADASQQRDPADALQRGMCAHVLREAVIGNPAGQMMDMVHADSRREPLQHFGEFIV